MSFQHLGYPGCFCVRIPGSRTDYVADSDMLKEAVSVPCPLGKLPQAMRLMLIPYATLYA